MAREAALEDLYQGLTTLARRARDVGDQLHPGLSLVAYTLLTQVDVTPGMRAADLAAHFCLDKSTLSRQLDQLISAGLLCRDCERPGRRGYVLTLTAAGRQHLDAAAQAVRDRLAGRLTGWDDHDIAAFARLVTRFNAAPPVPDCAGEPPAAAIGPPGRLPPQRPRRRSARWLRPRPPGPLCTAWPVRRSRVPVVICENPYIRLKKPNSSAMVTAPIGRSPRRRGRSAPAADGRIPLPRCGC